jgi:hypothetical protein
MPDMKSQLTVSPNRDHIFYTAMAAASALLVFAGFSRTYYLKHLFHTPELPVLAHLHGVIFTIWTLFFVSQVVLVAARRTDVHRRLGIAGGMLAGALVVLGTYMTVVSVRAGQAAGRPFMGVLLVNALVDLMLFIGFFVAGLCYRGKKEIHKRLMLLAMLSVIIPAYARLPFSRVTIGWLIMASPLFGIVYDAAVLRRMYATNVIGAAVIIGTTPLRFAIAATGWWQQFFEWVIR